MMSTYDDLRHQKEELLDEEASLLKEIAEFEGTVKRDSDMIDTLDKEIEQLESEANEKLRKLHIEQLRTLSLYSNSSTTRLDSSVTNKGVSEYGQHPGA